MSWMAPLPTWDTALPMHWVRPAAEYIPTGHVDQGEISPGAWRSMCGVLVSPIRRDGSRPVCQECAPRADYPYGEGPDD